MSDALQKGRIDLVEGSFVGIIGSQHPPVAMGSHRDQHVDGTLDPVVCKYARDAKPAV